MRSKLVQQPVEDLRVDFEDGLGPASGAPADALPRDVRLLPRALPAAAARLHTSPDEAAAAQALATTVLRGVLARRTPA